MEHLTDTTDADVDAAMAARGFTWYRDFFRWGKTPAYRSAHGEVRFIDRGDMLNATEMFNRLLNEWQPASHTDMIYASHRMRVEFTALPKQEKGKTVIYFTLDNTQGYNQETLDSLNRELALLRVNVECFTDEWHSIAKQFADTVATR